MNTYMKRRYRLIGIIISLAVILSCAFGSFFINNVSEVYADSSVLTLNASELKAGKYPEYYDNKTCEFNISSPKLLILNMDDTLHVNKCDIDAALEIEGERTLFIDGSVCVCGAVTINDNVGIAFNKSESGIYVLSDSLDKTYSFTCFGNITASNNNNNPIIWGDAEFIMSRGAFVAENNKSTLISINGDVYIEGGSVDIKSTNRFAKCRDFYICDGEIKADMNDSFLEADHFTMTGGKIDAYSHKNETIYTTKGTRISNGYIKAVSSDNSAFYTEGNMNITGGYVEAVSELNDNSDDVNGYSIIDKTHSPIDSVKEIIIGDGWGITEPADGKIIYDDVNLYRIVDSKGMWTRKVVIQKYEKKDDPSEDDTSKDDSSKDDASKDNSSKDDASKGDSDNNSEKNKPKYSNEWVNGKWYNVDGICDYAGTLSWKSNAYGWWVEDSEGWYPTSQWQKIDGKWYYFCADGYMDYSEYSDGYWLGADGAWDEAYSGGHWMSDSNGWWYEDASGWYPVSKWLWIDGSCYYFEASGYMARNKYVDGCWLGADGAWVK